MDDIGEPFPFEVEDNLPSTIQYTLSELAQFLAKDPAPILVFYGGEPTLALDKMCKIMDNVDAKAFIIQTNGLLLDNLETSYLERLHTILVSLDGDEHLTDYYRGKGNYRRAIENLKLLRKRGFHGELIARMTVGEETRLDEAVKWLLFNEEFPFNSIHWQLDAQFWRCDYDSNRIMGWFSRYNDEVNRLISYWVAHMEETGQVLKIYPFLGVTESLLMGETTKLRCGAGWAGFNIQTDGNITPCPVMAGMKNFYLGNIWETNPRDLVDAVATKMPCTECSILHICGGRCLYSNATKLWGEEGYMAVCSTVSNLIESLSAILPRVKQLIDNGTLKIQDFEYMKYNSCEIIP
ncbi:TIGR04084 family radical SAM/SPASM domain-containing protein [Candidatus Bathyarchaeota archaeon]|nr:TIGR04084 family radical SAM/SPASM domain-containing protein [Candidatus Bathyarchaeota archaeon]